MRTFAVLLVLCAGLSCGSARDHVSSAPPSAQPSPSDAASKKETAPTITAVEFFGSWKGSYVKLAQWKDTDDLNVPHPAVLDVLCTVANKTDSVIPEGDFVVLTTVDFIVAPTYAYAGDINKLIDAHTWVQVRSINDLRMGRVPFLRPNDQAQLKLEGFDLGKVVKEFDGANDTLWPWALRVNVRVMNREMTPVVLDQVVLPIFPPDKRLAAK